MFNRKQNTPMQLALIGGGINSAVGYAHWAASQLDNRWKVTAGCFSRNESLNHETAQAWDISEQRCYPNWHSLVEAEIDTVDAFVVLTPTPDHVDVVNYLLARDAFVICEKAMCANVVDCDQVVETLENSRGALYVTFNYTGYPMVREMRRLVLDGQIGKVLQVNIEMPSDAFIQNHGDVSPQRWRLIDGEVPTLLLDLGVHVEHLCRFITGGSATSVKADFSNFSKFEGIVDDAHLWVDYDSGFKAKFWMSKSALGHKNGLKVDIYGSRGRLSWVQEQPETLQVFDVKSVCSTYNRGNLEGSENRERFKPGHPGGFIEAFANLYSDLADTALEFKQSGQITSSPYVFDAYSAREGLQLLEFAAKAVRQDARVICGERVDGK